jgi:predicted nucleic acid-binding protein
MTNKTILCDTDFLVALLVVQDSNHLKAKQILEKYIDHTFVHSNLTKYELMTVLSRKLTQNQTIAVLDLFIDTFENEFQFDIKLENQVIEFYRNSANKNQSFFDIACLITAQKYGYKIASFDQFYPKSILAQ